MILTVDRKYFWFEVGVIKWGAWVEVIIGRWHVIQAETYWSVK